MAASTCPRLSAEQMRNLAPVPVQTVVDGDTLRLQGGRLVRFVGVNTPEIDHKIQRHSQPLALQARQQLQLRLKTQGNRVYLIDGQQAADRYQRRLAHVYTEDGYSLEYWLLQQGYGFHIVLPPNLSNLDCYAKAEAEARRLQRGVWSHTYYKARDVSGLTPSDSGFALIKARISHVGQSKRNIWLNLEPQSPGAKAGVKVAIQISRQDLAAFKRDNWRALNGRVLLARGWLSWRKRQQELVMRVHHPLAIEWLDH